MEQLAQPFELLTYDPPEGVDVPIRNPNAERPLFLLRMHHEGEAPVAGRNLAERALLASAGAAGACVMGLIGGVVGLVAGGLAGGLLGVASGAGRLEAVNQRLGNRYSPDSVIGLQKFETTAGTPGRIVREWVQACTHSTLLGAAAGATAGMLSGPLVGALGGGLTGAGIAGSMGKSAGRTLTAHLLGIHGPACPCCHHPTI